MLRSWAGHEAEGLIAVVRALDATALASKFDIDGDKTVPIERINRRHFVRMGAASALKPFLAAVKDRGDGVPWGRINSETMDRAIDYPVACGQIMHLIRMARLERYGVASTTMAAHELTIEVPRSVSEMAMQFSMEQVLFRVREETRPFAPKGGWPRLRHRMRRYVDSVDGWFIRYDNDHEIVAAFQGAAIEYGAGFLESEALLDGAWVGDRTFGEWKLAAHQALGPVRISVCEAH